MAKFLAWFNGGRRKRAYRVLMAMLAIAAGHGFVTAEDIDQISVALVALLGVGGFEVAARNISE